MSRPQLPRLELSNPALAGRVLGAVLTGGYAAWSAAVLPFFPAGWWLGLGALGAATFAWRQRLGLTLALAVPVLPLGNASLGLAVVYAGLAIAFLAAGWHEPRAGVFAVLGPLLGPLGALGLLPIAATTIRSPARRVLQVASAVVLAAVAAGIEHRTLPFTGQAPPRGIGVTGSEAPLDVLGSLLRALVAHPALVVEASVLGLAAAVLPLARAKGKWGTTGFAAALLGATILPVPAVKPWPLVLAAWATWLVLTLARRPET